MGINTDDYRNGFEQIRMTITIAGDAPAEKLRQVVQRGTDRSVVFDSITNGVPIAVDVITVLRHRNQHAGGGRLDAGRPSPGGGSRR